ncbi:MAG TPA: ECF-type sigma factor [Verrucomicrobiales bacterium]|nr:ECF-type sigma factor [Verrucomicrobiales bacterium]
MQDDEEESDEATRILNAIRSGDPNGGRELLEAVYVQLRRMASAKMAIEKPGQTLQPTALVHEAWLRLGNGVYESRAHFFGAAAEAMRRILVDRARRKGRAKHGGRVEMRALDGMDVAAAEQGDEILAVHEALDRLAAIDARKAELVKLRYFAGLSFEECAALQGVSVPTAKRDWSYARAWLHNAISSGG